MNKALILAIILGILLLFAVLAIVVPSFGKGISSFFGGTVLGGISSVITGVAHTTMTFGAAGFPQFLLVAGSIFIIGYILAWSFQHYLWEPIKNKLSPTSAPPTASPPTMKEPEPHVITEKPTATTGE